MVRAVQIALCLISLALFPVTGIAQETEEPTAEASAEPATVTAEDDGRRVFEDRIVVTASRQEEVSASTPAPISVIDAEMIQQYQPEKLADLFKYIPGVEIEGEGPFRGLPVIRGFSSNRVLILVDGQRLNNARESTTFAGIQPGLVNLAQVERIEVLRGPASVMYGSDAIGGVINIITRRPPLGTEEFTVHGDVAYEYGSTADSQNGRAMVSGSGKGFSFHIGAAVQDAGNYTAADGASEDPRFSSSVNQDNQVYNSGMKQSSFDGSLRFLTGSQGMFHVNVEALRTKDIGFPGFDPETSGVEISFPNFDRDKLGLAWSSGPVWGLQDISLNAYYQQVSKESVFNLSFPGFSSSSFTHSEIDSLGFNAQSIAEAGRHRITFGLDTYHDQVEDRALEETCFGPFCLPPSTETAVPKSRQTGIGVYAQDRFSVSDRVALHLGLRGDTFDFKSDENDPNYTGEHANDVTDSALSGNLGVTYSVTENVNLNAVMARGFRSPNLQERFFTGTEPNTGVLILQNLNLSSESSLNYELGFKAQYDRYYGGLSVFYNDVQDFITFGFLAPDDSRCHVPDQGCGESQNIGEATIWGVEFNLETIFADWWTLFTTAAYTEGDNDITNEPLSLIPPLKFVLGVRFQQPQWWAEAAARIVTSQDRVPADVEPSPGFTVYDLRAGYDFGCGLGVIVNLKNITDELYAETFNQDPEPGRNIRASLRYRF
jgi:hemoglobin/transferrin/lactoferrin receptor protein